MLMRGLMRMGILTVAASCLGADAPPKPDSVTYRDTKSGKEATKPGSILAETPESIQVKIAGGVTLDVLEKDLISVSHGDAPAEFQQAEDARQEGDYPRAAELYQAALAAKNVGDWIQHDARFGRADSLYRSGDLKGAAAVLVDMASGPAAKGRFAYLVKVRLGQCQIFQGQFDAAKATLETLRSPLGNWGDGARELWSARVLEVQKDPAGALQAYTQAVGRLARHPDLRDQAQARAAICQTALGKIPEALAALKAPMEQSQGEKPGGIALNLAHGGACLALAKGAAAKEEAQKQAFHGLMSYLKVVVGGESCPEDHAAALLGAEQCLTLLGDARAQEMRAERKQLYGDAFVAP